MASNLIQDFSVNFGGVLFGALLAFWIDRCRARGESRRLYGRVLQSCRFELGYLRSYVQSSLKELKAGTHVSGLSAGLPATRGALVNPLLFEHAPRPVVTVLNAVLDFTQVNAEGLKDLASVEPNVVQSDPAQEKGVQLRKALAESRKTVVESLTRLERMIGVAVETLDEELRRLRLATEPDPANHAMGQRLWTIFNEPIDS